QGGRPGVSVLPPPLGIVLRAEGKLADAIAVLRPAAEAGNPEAQWQLSAALALSTPPDTEGAARWLQRAPDGGNAKAKTMLQTQSQPTMQTDAQGRIATADFKTMIHGIIVAKAANM